MSTPTKGTKKKSPNMSPNNIPPPPRRNRRNRRNSRRFGSKRIVGTKRNASKKRKSTRPNARRFSICRNYKKSKCATDDKCSWRRNTGCIMGRGKSKRKLSKEIKAFAKKSNTKTSLITNILKKFTSNVEKAVVNLTPEQKNRGLLLIEDIKEATKSPKMIENAIETIQSASKNSPKVIKKIANASILMLEDIKNQNDNSPPSLDSLSPERGTVFIDGVRKSTRTRKPNPKYL